MSWKEFHEIEQEKEYFKKLWKFLDYEYEEFVIYPPKDKIYRAFDETPLDKVKVVIVGQDPYHGPNQANGLAFAVEQSQPIPPSLRNILNEATEATEVSNTKTLVSWAKQGVLLLNNVLTVRESSPKSHSKKGWEQYTNNAIKYLLQHKSNVLIFCLWGRDAESKRELIEACDNTNVIILSSSHPSPLAATKTNKPFIGSKQFEKINEILKLHNQETIEF